MNNAGEIRFPEHLISEIVQSQFYLIENSDIVTENDLNLLIELLFHFSDRAFYLFARKDQSVNHLIQSAVQHGVLLIEKT